jgi:hypothetical protein
MRNVFVIIILFHVFLSKSQDTLTVVHYNLLNYGNTTSYCTTVNNNINEKDGYLKTVINYLKPDIFTVNELGKSQSVHQHLLDQVLNTEGIEIYRKADFLKIADSYLVNMLNYNSEKLQLHSHVIAQSLIRDVDVYKLYYKSDDLASGDTAFIICVVSHLKAGSDDEALRASMAQNTMEFLDNYDDDNNYLMMGDFNLYSHLEGAYQTYLNYENASLRFNDPVDQYGNWHNNSYYSDYHTQSTHTSSNGCASTGGMDDRFDFILISNSIKDGTKDMHYIEDSYWAVGQDGLHFNKSLNSSPTNTSVPPDVLDALYNNSDHLPVTLSLYVDKTLGVEEFNPDLFEYVSILNPAQNQLNLKIGVGTACNTQLEVYNVYGHLLMQNDLHLHSGDNKISKSIQCFKPGIYFIRLTDEQSNTVVLKLIKN